MVAHWMMIFTIWAIYRAVAGFPLRCCLHTRNSRRSAPLYCMVMAAQDPARSPVPARAIVG
jgi:hypothetical protein